MGQFVFAPLATHLLMNYGWKAVIWVVAGLYLFCAVFGALLKPLTGDLYGEQVRPFSRKDLFYRGGAGTLMKADSKMQKTGQAWEDVRGLLFVNSR